MSDAIIARDVSKFYGDVQAVRGVSFDVRAAECYGLLGPNGAGKTTTMGMVRCSTSLDAGQLKVLGRDTRRHGRAIRSRIGVVPQHDSLDVDLSVLDNLLVYASYFGIRRREATARAEELLRFMALEDKAGVRIEALSGGMRRRLLIARGLINRPELLILDEPTTGLDPQARHHIWQRLRGLKETGTPMLLCTHYMDEAQQLCDRLAIIDQGRILAEDSPAGLIETHAGETVVEIQSKGTAPAEVLDRLGDALPTEARREQHGDRILCFLPPGQSATAACVEAADRAGLPLTTRPASLEDVFLNLTGRQLRE